VGLLKGPPYAYVHHLLISLPDEANCMHPQFQSADWSQARVLHAPALVTAACMLGRRLLHDRKPTPVRAEVFTGPPGPRERRASTASLAAASVLVPFASGMSLTWWIQPVPASASGPASTQLAQELFGGVVFLAAAFPALGRVLDDTARRGGPIRGRTLTAAAAGDLVSWTVLALVVAMAAQAGEASAALMVVEFLGLLLILRLVTRPLVTATLERGRTASANSSMVLCLILVGIFLSSCATAAMHLHPFLGTFAFGFACAWEMVALRASQRVEKFADASKILLPVFFVLTGLWMSFKDFGVHDVLITVIVIISASAAKILSMYATTRVCGVSSPGGWGLSLLMSARGLTGLMLLDVGRTAGVLSPRMFTVLAVMAIGTTLATGPLMENAHLSNTAPPVGLTKWRVSEGGLTLPAHCLSACLKPISTWATATSASGRPAMRRRTAHTLTPVG
jgi:Kef-type K+ transport system membrane component KefB